MLVSPVGYYVREQRTHLRTVRAKDVIEYIGVGWSLRRKHAAVCVDEDNINLGL